MTVLERECVLGVDTAEAKKYDVIVLGWFAFSIRGPLVILRLRERCESHIGSFNQRPIYREYVGPRVACQLVECFESTWMRAHRWMIALRFQKGDSEICGLIELCRGQRC